HQCRRRRRAESSREFDVMSPVPDSPANPTSRSTSAGETSTEIRAGSHQACILTGPAPLGIVAEHTVVPALDVEIVVVAVLQKRANDAGPLRLAVAGEHMFGRTGVMQTVLRSDPSINARILGMDVIDASAITCEIRDRVDTHADQMTGIPFK